MRAKTADSIARRAPRLVPRGCSVALFACLLAGAALESASAQPSAAVNRYVPAPHPLDGFGLRKAEVGPHLGWSAGLHIDYANDPLVYENSIGNSDSELVALVSDQVTAHLLGTLSVLELAQLAIEVPIHLVMDGQALGQQPTATGFGPGDLRLGAMLGLHRSALARVAFSGVLTAGTGERGDGRPGVAGDSSATFATTVHAAVHLGIVTLLGEVGARFRADTQIAGARFTDVMTYGLGAELALVRGLLSANLETQGESPLDDVGDRSGSPLGALLGMKLTLASGLVFGVGGGTGLLRGYGSPDARVVMSVGYAHGVASEPADKPKQAYNPYEELSPESPDPSVVVSNDEPEPMVIDEASLDSDGDGIGDLDDQCPEVPGGPEDNGCARLLRYDADIGSLTLTRQLNFAEASVVASKSPALEEIVAFLRANPKKRVRIEAHTLPPSARSGDSAISLSVRRAKALGEWLIAQGIAATRLEVMGCGDYRPIAPQRGSQRFKNERIELWVLEPLPPGGMHSSLGCIGHSLAPSQAQPAATSPQPVVNPVSTKPVTAPEKPKPVAPAPPPPPAPVAVIPNPAPVPPAPAPAGDPTLKAIELAPPLRFEEGGTEFKGKADAALDELAATLRADPAMKVLIAAHTAEDTDAAASLALSQKRAAVTRKALAKRGISGDRVRAMGCGQTRPVAPNNVPWGRKKNDRVEVLVLDPAHSTGVHSFKGCAQSEGT